MPESRRSSPRDKRERWHRLRRFAELCLPGERLSDLVTWAVLMLLVGLLALFVVREIRDGAFSGCPAYDGVTDSREAEKLCAEP